MTDSFRDKVVLVTGASSGIGAALAPAFSRAGAKVALTARRRERLEQVAASCAGPTFVFPGDITDPADRGLLLRETAAVLGPLDILVNNAGLGGWGGFPDSTEEEWRAIFEVNLFAPVALTREALPGMLARGQGLILNIASIGGLAAHSDKVAAYVSSKHALVGFSRGLARDLAGTGVGVKAACPHLTATEFFQTGPGAREMSAEAEKFRDFMDTPEEVAAGILAGLEEEGLILFPTSKPAKAYEKMREL